MRVVPYVLAALAVLPVAILMGCGSADRSPFRPADRLIAGVAAANRVGHCAPPDTFPHDRDPAALRDSITNPRSLFYRSYVPADFTVNWTASDDGRIREFRFRLFGTSNPDFPDVPDFVSRILSN